MKPSDRVIKFISNRCTHTAGQWAGKPFSLLPWQTNDIIKPFYDTLRPDGFRQYRFCYVEIPKKCGKTEFAAALGLYHLCADGEKGGEIYGAAADREQAGLVYRAAKIMVENDEKLSKRLKVIDSRKRIIDIKTKSFYSVLSAESYTKHGINPSCIIFDELHAQPNRELYDVLVSGTNFARNQQAVFILTTAGIFDPESIWWETRSHAIAVRDGAIDDPAFLPVLYIADKDSDPSDEKLWERVNPSCGHIFTLDKIREDYNRIKDKPAELNNFKRFRLNIPALSMSQWMPPDKWAACNINTINESELEGRECCAGLDLASTLDLTALVYVFTPINEGDPFDVLCRFYVPENNIKVRVHRDRVPYDVWVEQGYIKATPGDSVDYNFIIHDLMQDTKKFDIKDLAFDRWGSAKIIADLQELGFEDEKDEYAERRLVGFGQGYKSMSAPTKELTKLVYEGNINHGGNPVLRWCANNVYLDIDPAESVKPTKSKSTDRIDGIVALIMAIDRLERIIDKSEDLDITIL